MMILMSAKSKLLAATLFKSLFLSTFPYLKFPFIVHVKYWPCISFQGSMVQTIESSFVLDRQVDTTKVYEEFDNVCKVFSNSVMKNSVTIRVLRMNRF